MDTQDIEQVENEVETQEPEPAVEEISIPENWEPDVKDFINSIQDVKGKRAIFDKLKNDAISAVGKAAQSLGCQQETFAFRALNLRKISIRIYERAFILIMVTFLLI